MPAQRVYVYDGAKIERQYRGWNTETIRRQREYGTESNPKVWVMLEFQNELKSGLGIPLPRGKAKIYRRDLDGRHEFTGEDWIDHTQRMKRCGSSPATRSTSWASAARRTTA